MYRDCIFNETFGDECLEITKINSLNLYVNVIIVSTIPFGLPIRRVMKIEFRPRSRFCFSQFNFYFSRKHAHAALRNINDLKEQTSKRYYTVNTILLEWLVKNHLKISNVYPS